MFSHWGFRVVKTHENDEIYFKIAEVYYDEGNNPIAWTVCNENALKYNEYENLKETVDLISNAFDHPTLTIDGESLKNE